MMPVETEADGLTLNWGSNHWYWGYYVKDYPVKAFQLARKYLPAETKLFVNDYNLETSPNKLDALIKFVKEIDEKNGSPIVDGIGTQMHVTLSSSDDAEKNAANIAALKEQVDAMFKTMVVLLVISLVFIATIFESEKATRQTYQLLSRAVLPSGACLITRQSTNTGSRGRYQTSSTRTTSANGHTRASATVLQAKISDSNMVAMNTRLITRRTTFLLQ